MDRTRHSNVRYLTNKIKVNNLVNSSKFKALEEMEMLYEVETYKSHIIIDNPMQIGFFYFAIC